MPPIHGIKVYKPACTVSNRVVAGMASSYRFVGRSFRATKMPNKAYVSGRLQRPCRAKAATYGCWLCGGEVCTIFTVLRCGLLEGSESLKL